MALPRIRTGQLLWFLAVPEDMHFRVVVTRETKCVPVVAMWCDVKDLSHHNITPELRAPVYS